MSHWREAALRVMDQCDALSSISCMSGGIDRRYLTDEHRRCNHAVASWMQEAGLGTEVDQAGNIRGLLSDSGNTHTLLVGSHLDSVPDAGRYDGILGVLLPLAALAELRGRGETLPFDVELIGFGDEEGTRFGTTLLGSRAVAGTWDPAWFELEDGQGISLRRALTEFGCEPDAIGSCSRAGTPLLGYLEVHIEQGPVLEQRDQALGVVSSIAGAKRFNVQVLGHAGHAGTVPMELRHDALVAAARAVTIIERCAREHGVVATVGRLSCAPGAPNVIPGEVNFTLDIRSGDDARRDAALQEIRRTIDAELERGGFGLSWRQVHEASAVGCAEWIQALLDEVLEELRQPPLRLLSGAGHDAMSFDGLCDVGMLFVRCKGGISHHPGESITVEDVAVALEAFHLALLKLARAYPSLVDKS